ncbi:MAG TPA: cytochrome b/b6 domain-containing protein [Acidobacteriaceae bacterium]|nr:cytochrome b/b6 domain-containing protein [Acidobacteriaceae bacterium]
MPTTVQTPEHVEPATVLRRSLVVRVTHWLTFIAFIALLVTGIEILISHPRFYWGEVGNVNTHPLFTFHIPSSRDTVPTGYGYTLPDQNGWSRYLHFEAAWLLVLTGVVYLVYLFFTGHLRRNLFPTREQRSLRAYTTRIGHYLRRTKSAFDDHTYNVLQRTSYLIVIFVLFPLIIWTGLAMSPAVTTAFPLTSSLLGGRQSARTIHLFLTIALVLFLIIHVTMVAISGFRTRMRAMITGKATLHTELTTKELP